MTMKHTKGPWEFKKGDYRTIFADGDSIMGDMHYYPWAPDNEADWHLIAAAPELLSALQRLLKSFPTDTDMYAAGWESLKVDEACNAYDDARKVIAKAIGEQA